MTPTLPTREDVVQAVYQLACRTNTPMHPTQIVRDLHVTPFAGNYGVAGVVLAVNGSPPHGVVTLLADHGHLAQGGLDDVTLVAVRYGFRAWTHVPWSGTRPTGWRAKAMKIVLRFVADLIRDGRLDGGPIVVTAPDDMVARADAIIEQRRQRRAALAGPFQAPQGMRLCKPEKVSDLGGVKS